MILPTDYEALVQVQAIAQDSGESFYAGNFTRAIKMLDKQEAKIEELRAVIIEMRNLIRESASK